MRKAIFLGAFLLAVGAFTSCSKDEPTPMDEALKDVSGTEWLGYYKYDGYTLYFYRNGEFDISNSHSGFASGTYVQNGKHITFTTKTKWAFYYDVKTGDMNTPGIMTIPFYQDGRKVSEVDFALNVLKD